MFTRLALSVKVYGVIESEARIMAQQRSTRQKSQMDSHQKHVRRNQYIMAGFSILIVLSMLISLVNW